MAISTISNSATGTQIATAVNALIALVEHASSGNNANNGYADAVALITALVAAGSVVIDGEGSGILTETTD